MATHDYNIANQSGAAFRTDLNNALAAIQSNNSNSSSPATTVAYQWWADTTAGVMKIRNGADNAWIELFQLDGTLTLEDGSNSAPALAFRDDLDTGIFSAGVNQINFATTGVSRLDISSDNTIFNESGADIDFRIESDSKTHMFFIDAGNNRIGINESAPSTTFHVSGAENTTIAYFDTDLGGRGLKINTFSSGNAASAGVEFEAPAGAAKSAFAFKGASEFMRIDVNGDVAIGSSDPQGNKLLVQLTNDNSDAFKVIGGSTQLRTNISLRPANNDATGFTSYRLLNSSDVTIGSISIQNSTDHLTINASKQGGAMIFKTSSSGDSLGTQTRMTILDTGVVGIGEGSPSTLLHLKGTDTAYGGVGNSTTACGAKIRVQDTAGRIMEIVSPGSAAEAGIGSITNHNFTFFTSNTERARFMSGNLSDPAFIIARTNTTVNSSNFGHVFFYDGAVAHFRDVTGANTVFRSGGNQGGANIFGDGDITNNNNSYGQASDETLKQDIVDAASQWNDIKGLRVRKFRFKDNPTGVLQIGVVAQEIETVSAGLVQEDKDGIKSVKYSVLYMKAVKCLQEAIAKIEVLETKVAALEAA